MLKTAFITVVLILAGSFACAAKEPAGLNVRDLAHLEWLMYKQPGQTLEISSYDRSGGNDDGYSGKYSYLRIDRNGEYVVMESHKPGAIVQIWFTDLSTAGHIHFYFDGAKHPQIDLDIHDFFSGKHYPFVTPFVYNDTLSSGGFVCFLPMPYHKSCKITTTGIARYYHIIYRVFRPGAGITTFSLPLNAAAREELASTGRILDNVGTSTPKAGFRETMIPAGATKTIWSAEGRRYIKSLFLHSSDMSAGVLKRLVLRIYWDGAKEPSVESPLLDFFGNGFRAVSYTSLCTGYSNGDFYSGFPMPFKHSAKIEIENGNGQAVKVGSDVEIENLPVRNESNLLYFHSQFQQDTTVENIPVTILETKGTGHFVGTRQTMQSFPGKIYNRDSERSRIDYLEGDETVYVNGDSAFSWHGTGTEDYYDGGWYFRYGPFHLPFNGCLEKIPLAGSISAYRFQITDMIPFKSQFKMFIEHGAENTRPGVYYSTVAYWYQSTPESDAYRTLDPAKLSVPMRIVWKQKGVDYLADNMQDLVPHDGKLTVMPWSESSPSWKGISDVAFRPEGRDASLGIVLHPPISGEYSIDLQYSVQPSGGKFETRLGGAVLSPMVDTYAPDFTPGENVRILAHLKEGADTLMASSVGKDEHSEGNRFLFTSYNLRPEPEGHFVTEWKVVGPFNDSGFVYNDSLLGPERDFQLKDTFIGEGGKSISWETAGADSNGAVNLVNMFKPHEYTIAYAGTRVFSPAEQKLYLFAGSDDGIRIFVNGKAVWTHFLTRGLVKDEDRVLVTLQKGWNTLTLEITQGIGDWAFALRIPDYPGKKLELH